jgi:hypothetical protein
MNDIFTSASSFLISKLCTLEPSMFTYIVSLIDTGCACFLHSLDPNMTDDACAEGMDALAHSVVDAGSGPELGTCHSSSHLLVMDHHQFA